jgi:hypothetical protein
MIIWRKVGAAVGGAIVDIVETALVMGVIVVLSLAWMAVAR